MAFPSSAVALRWLAVGGVLLLAGGCEEKEPPPPTAEQVKEHFAYRGGRLELEMDGNVAEITVTQPWSQVRRGGSLWARVGPYVVLFSPQTQEAFDGHPGLAGVRVTTRTPGGTEIASALLARTGLNEITWRRALNIAGKARTRGTKNPRLIEDLIRWGEDHTVEHSYNPEFIE